MTVPVQTPINSYVYAGGSSFNYSFQLLQSADLLVTVDGAVKTLGVDYTVAGVGVQAGGTITYLGAITVGQLVSLSRQTTLARTTDYQTLGDFLAGTINSDFDRLWMALQERVTNDARSVRVPAGETLSTLPAAASRAGFLLGFDGAGGLAMIAAAAQSASALALSLLSSAGSTFIMFLQAGAGAVLRTLQSKLREWPSATDFGAVGDGVTLDTAAFTAAQVASAFVYLPQGKTFLVGAGLNYWQFYGPGVVFENGKQWTVAPYPQSGQIGKFYNPRTFGIYEQTVALAVTINSGVGQTKENTQVLGTDTLGLAQTYTDRDHVAGYFSAYSYVPDVLDGTTTYTSTSLSNAAIGALYAAGKIKLGMIVDTLHATICTGRIQSVAGNVATVDVWYARSGGGATTPANGTGAIINPNTKVFGRNTVVSASGNGTTTGANQCVGDEIDISTGGTVGSPQVSPRAGTLGHDFAVAQYSYADVIIRVRGQRNISFLSTNSGGAGLFGLVSIGDGRGVSVQDATSLAMEVLQGGITKFSVDPAGVVATPKIQSNAATLQGAIAAQCTTAFVNVGVAATNGSLYFISGFNVSGGAQGAWLLMARSGVLTTISASDGSGNTVVFQVSGEQLQIKTTTGTFQYNVFQVSL